MIYDANTVVVTGGFVLGDCEYTVTHEDGTVITGSGPLVNGIVETKEGTTTLNGEEKSLTELATYLKKRGLTK